MPTAAAWQPRAMPSYPDAAGGGQHTVDGAGWPDAAERRGGEAVELERSCPSAACSRCSGGDRTRLSAALSPSSTLPATTKDARTRTRSSVVDPQHCGWPLLTPHPPALPTPSAPSAGRLLCLWRVHHRGAVPAGGGAVGRGPGQAQVGRAGRGWVLLLAGLLLGWRCGEVGTCSWGFGRPQSQLVSLHAALAPHKNLLALLASWAATPCSLSSLETRVLMGERLGERYGGGDAVA
jgi:hypothetical protein